MTRQLVRRDARGRIAAGTVLNPQGSRAAGMSTLSYHAAMTMEQAAPRAAQVLVHALSSGNEWARIAAAREVLQHVAHLDEGRARAQSTSKDPTVMAWMSEKEIVTVMRILERAKVRRDRGEAPRQPELGATPTPSPSAADTPPATPDAAPEPEPQPEPSADELVIEVGGSE